MTAETNIAPQSEITDRAEVAPRDRPVLLGTVLLSLAIFLAVCLAPVSHSVWPILVWPFYMIPLLLTGLTRERRYPPMLAALCTVLVVLGYFFSSPGLYPLATMFRHAIGVGILWGTAVLLVRRIREGEVTGEQRNGFSESQRLAHTGNWRYHRTGRITWSDEMYRIYGCSPNTFTPHADSFRNLIHPEDRTAMQAWIATCMAGEKHLDLEFRAVLPDGRVRKIKSSGELRCDRNGSPLYIAGTAQDITEQKQEEEALQAVEDRLRRGRMGTFDWDIAHNQLTWSRGLEELFGGPGLFSGTYETFAQRVHPEDLPGFNAEIARCMAARDSYAREYRVVWPDGSVHWMAGQGEFTFTDAGRAVAMRGVVLDITERKQAEAALRETEDRYRDLVENSEDLLCTHDLSGKVISCNPAQARILGYTVEEMLHTPMCDLLAPEHRDEFNEYLARVQKDGIAEGLMLVITRTGERRVWEYRNTLRTEGVPVPIVRGMAHDITERKRAEAALRVSEEKFASIFRSSPDAIVLTTVAEGRFLEVNDKFARLTGYERNEVLGRTAAELGFWPDPTTRKQLTSLLDQPGGIGEFEYEIAIKPGGSRSIVISGEKIEFGGQACMVCTVRDITERKRALELLRRQALMLENMHDAVMVVDEDYNITDWNPAATRIFGYEKTEVLGRSVSCLHAPEAAKRQLGSITTGLESAGRWDGELAAVRKDGTRFMVRSVIVPLRDEHGTQIGIISVSRDISERKRAEVVLRASEARLREYERVVEGLDEMIAVIDREYRYLIANHAFLKYHGLKSEELIGRRVSDVLGPGAFERVIKAKLDECFQGRVVKYEMNYSYPELGERGLFISYFPIEGPAGVERVACVLQDVTERKRAERALQDSEEKYRILFESSPHPMWVYHVPSLRFLAVNEAAIRHYGYTREEFLAMTLRDIRPPEDIPAMEQSALHSPYHDKAGTWRHLMKDGRTIYVEIADCRVNFEGQTASLVLATDVTERHVLEDELRRAQHLEAVGRLAGGVAHDFNNILTAIQMSGSLLAGGLVPPDRMQEKSRDILASADRGAALTRQLLAFARKQVLEPRILDLNEMLRGLSFLMRGIIPENISVTASLCTSLGLVKADPHQLENVIINLVINARNAMPSGGRLGIETSNVDASGQSEAMTRILPPGQYVMVAVSDTGIGMDPATQARIFEPFFTTNGNEGGTGLGLAMSYGTVKQSGGYIFVQSARGEGTTFNIFFPVVESEPQAVLTAAEPRSLRGRGETVLLVEDEDLVRKSTAEFLSAHGYVVIEARSGQEALQLAMSRPSHIAVVVTDLVMPGIDGREVVEILRQLRPQMKAVLMSGYAERLEAGEKEAASFKFLQKPFAASVLASTLREVISGS